MDLHKSTSLRSRPFTTSAKPSSAEAFSSEQSDANAPQPASNKRNTPQWLTFAIASGVFAAFNGVFAKLTTASHTQGLVLYISQIAGLADDSRIIELVIRAICFGLNLVSNAIMWILFTRALTAATSTTRVSIMNTSTNFFVTAILGMLVFGEELPLMWWFGAALLVAGTVVIGARESKEQKGEVTSGSGLKVEADANETSGTRVKGT